MPETNLRSSEMTVYTEISTPIGGLLIAGDKNGLKEIYFQDGTDPRREPDPDWTEDAEALTEATTQLEAYFAGELRDFDLPLAPEGTAFQLSVWSALAEIPYGETVSYGELADRVGRPKAARAVGAANGKNPLPIVLPCHRVIGSTGKLVGFGGGLHLKQALLEGEHRVSSSQGSLFQ